MSPDSNAVTVGVDVGTTSVKAVAVDEKGQVVARSRVPHSVVAPEPDRAAPRRQKGLVERAPQGIQAGNRRAGRPPLWPE